MQYQSETFLQPVSGAEAELLNQASGTCFRAGDRMVRFEKVNEAGTVELRDLKTLKLLQVFDDQAGSKTEITPEWLRAAYAQGLLQPVHEPKNASERQKRNLLLDPELADQKDAKARWRYSLCWRIIESDVLKTDEAYSEWLAKHYGDCPLDQKFPCPSASSVRRWVRRLEGCKRVGALASSAGRPRGHSQLAPEIDALTTEAALRYYEPGAKIVAVQSWLHKKIDELNACRLNTSGKAATFAYPSKETLRKRVHQFRCHETVKAKSGTVAADIMFRGSGEPMRTTRPLELCFMDATTLEQTVVMGDDWALPSNKAKITLLMCSFTHAIVGGSVYVGPNRHETSVNAILDCMLPSFVPEAMLNDFPELANIFGRPAAILPDNEQALIGPSMIPALNEAGITVMLPPRNTPTAKAVLERAFRSIKEKLETVPGTILGPGRHQNSDDDGIASATLNLNQLRVLVSQIIAEHNVSSSKGLGGRSPLQVWMSSANRFATPMFEDINHIRRVLGRTTTALLTRDGIEHDGIRYRDSQKVTGLLESLGRLPRAKERKDGSRVIRVKIRRYDGNLDTIDVYDENTGQYVTLPSTQPEYTHNLTAWDHQYLQREAKNSGKAFKSQNDRLNARAHTLQMIDQLAPKLAFQRRRNMQAFYESSKLQNLTGRALIPFPSDAITSPQGTFESQRMDDGLPPEVIKGPMPGIQTKYRAPARSDDYGRVNSAVRADELDWGSVQIEDITGDPETGLMSVDDYIDEDDAFRDGDV